MPLAPFCRKSRYFYNIFYEASYLFIDIFYSILFKSFGNTAIQTGILFQSMLELHIALYDIRKRILHSYTFVSWPPKTGKVWYNRRITKQEGSL